MLLVRSPPWFPEQMEGYLERAMDDALSVGLTAVHDALASEEFLNIFQKYNFLLRAATRGTDCVQTGWPTKARCLYVQAETRLAHDASADSRWGVVDPYLRDGRLRERDVLGWRCTSTS